MLWINRTVGAALIAGVVPLWALAGGFPGTGSAFPRTILAALAILAVALLARGLARGGTPRGETEGSRDPRTLVRPLVSLAAGLGAVLLMDRVGFFPAMIALAAALIPVLRVENRRLYVLVVVILLICVHLLFVLLLGVPLATWRVATR